MPKCLSSPFLPDLAQVPASLREFVLLGKLPSKEHAAFVRSHTGEHLISSSSSSSSSSSGGGRAEDTPSWQGQQWAPA
eukprot:1157649-Pelagomonas_calceolata.AAC.3